MKRRTAAGLACALATTLGFALAHTIGAWTVAGSGEAIYTATADGGLLFYCSDAGALEADVGPYGRTPGTEYVLTFQVEGAEPLELRAPVGPATAVLLAGDDAAALVAFLREAPTTTVAMALAGLPLPGGPLTFDLPTHGLDEALAELPCGPS
jgi:hypothetical protein